MSRRGMSENAARMTAVSVTSNGITRVLLPPVVISRATSSSSLGVRLTSTSSEPAAASANATARPMPRPAPVTSAVLPSRRKALSSDFASIGFQQAPCRRACPFPPACVEVAELAAEAGSLRSIDPHAPSRQLLGSGGIDLFDVLTLQQRVFLGIALDDFLDCARQRAPSCAVGQQREPRPPMRGQAQMSLDLVEPQRQYDAERVALPVEAFRLQRFIHLIERYISSLGPK